MIEEKIRFKHAPVVPFVYLPCTELGLDIPGRIAIPSSEYFEMIKKELHNNASND